MRKEGIQTRKRKPKQSGATSSPKSNSNHNQPPTGLNESKVKCEPKEDHHLGHAAHAAGGVASGGSGHGHHSQSMSHHASLSPNHNQGNHIHNQQQSTQSGSHVTSHATHAAGHASGHAPSYSSTALYSLAWKEAGEQSKASAS